MGVPYSFVYTREVGKLAGRQAGRQGGRCVASLDSRIWNKPAEARTGVGTGTGIGVGDWG